ncbi:DMT family transporter [Leptolyngbya sp. 15MV]|nr:DMT family transporter [Leptolyngbya sp. 15MV]
MSETPPHALLRPRIAIPFVLVALIWGSTWYVITGQIDQVPPSWSVTYRFALATPAMFALALAMKQGWRLSGAGHALALLIGATQFCGNFNFDPSRPWRRPATQRRWRFGRLGSGPWDCSWSRALMAVGRAWSQGRACNSAADGRSLSDAKPNASRNSRVVP